MKLHVYNLLLFVFCSGLFFGVGIWMGITKTGFTEAGIFVAMGITTSILSIYPLTYIIKSFDR